MLTNNTAIKQLNLSNEDLINIRKELKVRNLFSFNQKITNPLNLPLVHWIEKEYPSLILEKEDILFGVFRRLKNRLLKADLSTAEFNISQHLLEFLRVECESIIPTEENRKKNLGLDKGDFKKLLTALQAGDETLIEQVYLSHFKKCVNFLISSNHCSREVAYDCSIDALVEIRKDLLNNKIRYGNLGSYFTTRALSKLYKYNKKHKLKTLPISEDIDFLKEQEGDDALVQKELREILNTAMNNLCDECRFILKQFYYEERSLQEIGVDINKNYDAVRKQASRCRIKLKKYIGEKFYRQYEAFFNK